MKKLMATLLGITLTFSLMACGSEGTTQQTTEPKEETATVTESEEAAAEETEAEAEEKGKIGIIAPNMALDFQIKMGAGIKKAADEKGYEYMEFDYKGDPEQEIAGIETMAAMGVQGVYGIFMTPETDIEKFAEYPEIGIISQAPSLTSANGFIQDDYAEIGKEFVDSLDNFMEEIGTEEGEIAAIWISSCENKDSFSHSAMTQIQDVIVEHYAGTKHELVANYFAKDAEEASNITTQILNANPDVKYLFAYNNNYAVAAANELQAAMPDTSEYFVFSSEADEECLRLIESGTSPLKGCSYNDVEATGYATGLELVNWIENGTVNDVTVSRKLVDKRNVAEVYQK